MGFIIVDAQPTCIYRYSTVELENTITVRYKVRAYSTNGGLKSTKKGFPIHKFINRKWLWQSWKVDRSIYINIYNILRNILFHAGGLDDPVPDEPVIRCRH